MMMFWLLMLCLMSGSSFCAPVKKAATGSRPQVTNYPYWVTWMNPDMGNSNNGFEMPSQPDPSPVEEAPAQEPIVSAGSQHGYPYAALGNEAPADNYGSVYGDNTDDESVKTQEEEDADPADATVAYGEAAEAPEPVFSDVSDLEPVFSFRSRSRYNRGRAVFSQTRYTPGEPAPFLPMPMSKYIPANF